MPFSHLLANNKISNFKFLLLNNWTKIIIVYRFYSFDVSRLNLLMGWSRTIWMYCFSHHIYLVFCLNDFSNWPFLFFKCTSLCICLVRSCCWFWKIVNLSSLSCWLNISIRRTRVWARSRSGRWIILCFKRIAWFILWLIV